MQRLNHRVKGEGKRSRAEVTRRKEGGEGCNVKEEQTNAKMKSGNVKGQTKAKLKRGNVKEEQMKMFQKSRKKRNITATTTTTTTR